MKHLWTILCVGVGMRDLCEHSGKIKHVNRAHCKSVIASSNEVFNRPFFPPDYSFATKIRITIDFVVQYARDRPIETDRQLRKFLKRHFPYALKSLISEISYSQWLSPLFFAA